MAATASPSKLALVRRYLRLRRAMGYRMRAANLLFDFARFVDRLAPGRPLSMHHAVQWASAVRPAQPTTWANRLGMVRSFARFCATIDPRTQIPDRYAFGPFFHHRRPHVYTAAEIQLLLRRSQRLEIAHSPLHPRTYETLIGLLAVTGMRPGEALRLRLDDFDADHASLRIRPCKFSPERTIPLHASAVRALMRYRSQRLQYFPWGATFFVGATGRPLLARRTARVFAHLTRRLRPRGERRNLRLLDFRHTFASQRIAQWSRETQPVAHHLLLLARYLGHRTFQSTWWYVASDPHALRVASERFRHACEVSHDS